MKIIYVDNKGNKRLQDMNLAENKQWLEENGKKEDVYNIRNIVTDCMSDAIDDHVKELAWVLKDNGWQGDTIRYMLKDHLVNEDVEEKQTVYFNRNYWLMSDERDAFWAAVTEAVKRGDRLFDTEEWYSAYKLGKEKTA